MFRGHPGDPDWPAMRGGGKPPAPPKPAVQEVFGFLPKEPAPRPVITVIRFSGTPWYMTAVGDAIVAVADEFPDVEIRVVEARADMKVERYSRDSCLVVVDCDSRQPDPASGIMLTLRRFAEAELPLALFAVQSTGLEVLNYLDRATTAGLPEHYRKNKKSVVNNTAALLRNRAKRLLEQH